MTEETNKLRALILTVLMVTSVFAGTVALAGTAAAANNTSITLTDDIEGQTTDYTFDATLEESGTVSQITVDFGDADVSDVQASDISVTADGNSVGGVSVTQNGSGVVTFTHNDAPAAPGAAVSINIANVTNPAAGDHSYSVNLLNSSGGTVDSWSDTYNTKFESANSGGDVLFQGQTAQFSGFTPGATVVLRENTSDGTTYRNEYVADSAGQIEFDTSDYEGSFFVRESGTQKINFEIVPQTFSVNFDSDTVANSGEDSEVTLEVDSNRASSFSAYVLSENMTDTELVSVFSNSVTSATDVDIDGDGDVGDDDGILVTDLTRNDNSEATLDFTDVEAGPKDITFSVSDTTASASDNITVSAPADGSAGFATQAISDERGDIVTVNVSVTGATDRATINFGGPDVSYQESVTVVDDNDDGYVEFYWNTAKAGTSDQETFALPYGSDDDLTNRQLSSQFVGTSQRLGAAEYPVNATVGGDETGVATVVVRNPNDVERSINTWTAPEGKNALSPTSDDYYADFITQDSTVAIEDELVLEIQTAGIYGSLVPDATQDAVSVGPFTQVSGAQLNITQTADSTPANTPSATINTTNKTALLSPGTNTLFMFVDTGTDNFSVTDRNPRQTYNVNMTFTGDWAYGKNRQSTVSQVSIIQRTGDIDGAEPNSEDPLTVTQSDSAEITGTSSVATGTNLTVTARSSSGQNPFLRQGTATVQSDGTWSATLDLSDIPEGTNFTVSVNDGSDTFEAVDARIGGAANIQLASLDAPETATPGETITVTATVENTGDSSGETEVAFVFANETVATQNVTVDAGSTAEVTFEPTVPSETGDYTHGVQVGDNDVVTAGITVQEETTTTEPTTTEPTTTEPTTTEPTTTEPTTTEPTTTEPTTSEEPDDETTTEESGGQPGFGVAVALVALLAAALLATRRDN